MTIRLFPGAPRIRGDAPELAQHGRSRCRQAACHARRVYPGPLGELVFRELSAYAEFGYRFDSDGLIPRLAAAVLATRADHHLDAGRDRVLEPGERRQFGDPAVAGAAARRHRPGPTK